MVRAGAMDRRVVFQRRQVVSARERGGFEDVLTAWASYRAATGREQAQAGQAVAFRSAALTIRDCAAAREITEGWRAVIDGTEYNITTVAPPGRSGFIEIAIETGLPAT